MNVTIVGGGSSAHLLAVLLAGREHSVTILTRRPAEWSMDIELETDDGVLKGKIRTATDDPVRALECADVAILCMPVHQYPIALQWMVPGLTKNPRCIVGTVFGQAGFDWMIKGCCKKNNLNLENYFAIGLLPWIARTKIYGKRAISYGPKEKNSVACSNDYTFKTLSEGFLDDLSVSYWNCGKFERVPNFITLTLTVDNQIIHPSRCYGLANKTIVWPTMEDVPYFYREFDEFSADVMRGVDADYTTIRKALLKRYPRLDNPYMLDYLDLEHWSYGSHNPDIKASFVNSKTLRDIKPPVVKDDDGMLRLDVKHRFFKDDLAFGLEIAHWFAQQLDCEVPHIEKIINWYEEKILPVGGERLPAATPEFYGLTLDEAVN